MEVSKKRGTTAAIHSLHVPPCSFFWYICLHVFPITAKCLTSSCWIKFWSILRHHLTLLYSLFYGFFFFFFEDFISHNLFKPFLSGICLWSALFLSVSTALPSSWSRRLLLQLLPDLIPIDIQLCHGCPQCPSQSITSVLSQSTAT